MKTIPDLVCRLLAPCTDLPPGVCPVLKHLARLHLAFDTLEDSVNLLLGLCWDIGPGTATALCIIMRQIKKSYETDLTESSMSVMHNMFTSQREGHSEEPRKRDSRECTKCNFSPILPLKGKPHLQRKKDRNAERWFESTV